MIYDIQIYDAIGGNWWGEGVTDKWFVEQLKQAEKEGATEIRVNISSNGGDVKHCLGIISAIQRSKTLISTHNHGLVASAAADIWAAGHKRYAAAGSLVMIHAAAAGCYGMMKATELRKLADTVDKFTSATSVAWNKIYQIQSDNLTFQQRFYDDADHFLDRNEVSNLFQIETDAQAVENAPKNKSDAQKRYQQFVKQITEKAQTNSFNKTISINDDNNDDMTPSEIQALIDSQFEALTQSNSDALKAKEAEIAALKVEKDAKIAEIQAKLDAYVSPPPSATIPEQGKRPMTAAQLKAHKEIVALAAERGLEANLPTNK